MRASLKKCLVLILLVVVFDSACRKSNTPEGVSSSRSAAPLASGQASGEVTRRCWWAIPSN